MPTSRAAAAAASSTAALERFAKLWPVAAFVFSTALAAVGGYAYQDSHNAVVDTRTSIRAPMLDATVKDVGDLKVKEAVDATQIQDTRDDIKVIRSDISDIKTLLQRPSK